MDSIGRRVYYDKLTGKVLVCLSERSGHVVETSVEDDIQTYKALSERNRETFDYIQLEYGEYAQDFMECNGYRINPETKELEFSYPDPNADEPTEPVYQKPLSEQMKELDVRTLDIELTLAEILFN